MEEALLPHAILLVLQEGLNSPKNKNREDLQGSGSVAGKIFFLVFGFVIQPSRLSGIESWVVGGVAVVAHGVFKMTS